jgi:hypothetical protein
MNGKEEEEIYVAPGLMTGNTGAPVCLRDIVCRLTGECAC